MSCSACWRNAFRTSPPGPPKQEERDAQAPSRGRACGPVSRSQSSASRSSAAAIGCAAGWAVGAIPAAWARRRASAAASEAEGAGAPPQASGWVGGWVANGAGRGTGARATGARRFAAIRCRGSVRFQYHTVSIVSSTATVRRATMNHLTLALVMLSWATRRPDTSNESSGLTLAHGDMRTWFFRRSFAEPAQRRSLGSVRPVHERA